MRVFKTVLLLLFLTGRAFSASPELSLSVENGKIMYNRSLPQIDCNGVDAAGCTEAQIYMDAPRFSYDENGNIAKVDLRFGLRNITVYILSTIPKGSCEFDLTLKHELTHVSVARKVVKRYAAEISKALLARLDEGTAGPYQIAQMIDRYRRQMIAEKNRQDRLMDAPGAVVYQWEQCLK
ncbi:MAG TPA: hypothetical protein DD624_06765 [Alphaproteobacteria bacterium]|nr:hypothetical protein [Alphaproteobacteria bacterium]